MDESCGEINASFYSDEDLTESSYPLDLDTSFRESTASILPNGFPPSSTPYAQQENNDGETNGQLFHDRRHSDMMERYNRAYSYDSKLFNLREISPDKIAEQVTLIDLALLKGIRRNEFYDCGWTKKDKRTIAPNIVTFSHRFNHTSFLIVRDVLNEENVKVRAEIVVHFIKVAKRLQELNNLNSLVAIVLALQSPPIIRLQNTWKIVPKKDKINFERLTEFISEEDNYQCLREQLDLILKHHYPCIPYLGLHQRDLVHLDTMGKRSENSDQDKQKYKLEVEKVIDFVSLCQQSKYDDLMPHKGIQKYLSSDLYISEFQKFFEDDNYKLSLQIEPPDPISRKLAKHSVVIPPPSSNSSTSKLLRNSKSSEDLLTPLKPEYTGPTAPLEIVTTPPKCTQAVRYSVTDILTTPESSLGVSRTELLSSEPPKNKRKGTTLPPNLKPPPLDWKSAEGRVYGDVFESNGTRKLRTSSPNLLLRRKAGHVKSQSLGNNVLAAFGLSKQQSSRSGSPELPHHVSLLDDSVMDDAGFASCATTPGSTDFFTPPLSATSGSSIDANSLNEDMEHHFDREISPVEPPEVIYDGILKRRVIKKDKKSVQFKLSHYFWVKLTDTYILLLPPKYKGSKKAVNSTHIKYISLFGCRVKHGDPLLKLKDTQFIIQDNKGNQMKFTAETADETNKWVNLIRDAIMKEEDRLRRKEEETPLIKF